MRILHIDTGRELRGGQRQALLLMRTLRAGGHLCCLMAPALTPLSQQADEGGFNVLPASLLSVWRYCAGFDLVHAHDARAHTLAAVGARVPFVVSRRVAFPVGRSLASRWKYGRAARFLAVSEFVSGQLRAAGVPGAKIDMVYDAVELSAVDAEWKPEAPIVALASADPQKGRDLVERAAAMAGVSIVFSSDLANDLQHASLFLYISRSEGFGSAALLAMSLGVPVVASRIEGLREVFEDGISGLSVENDPAAIAAAMERVRSQPELARLLVENARQRVAEQFTPDHLLERTLAAYRRALDR